jgi:aminoglycoside phosphotransferase (APT) family kinase protein
VLDWEFARYGNPLEDLGWFLARCWRYGRWEREAGGIGSRAAFLDAYETAAGHAVDRSRIPLFELLATLRWAVIALMQARRHYSGEERSLELALTLHVVPTLEQDILAYVDAIERGSGA